MNSKSKKKTTVERGREYHLRAEEQKGATRTERAKTSDFFHRRGGEGRASGGEGGGATTHPPSSRLSIPPSSLLWWSCLTSMLSSVASLRSLLRWERRWWAASPTRMQLDSQTVKPNSGRFRHRGGGGEGTKKGVGWIEANTATEKSRDETKAGFFVSE